ncbi:response regulator [Desulfovibrio sp. JC022]|uniref:response regulator n=1 Tax=Desulfovibrio sp. JC022 TaxID=2593642 RepID=UPI0013D25539|nr:response regulator [Desulfovibrio sp. JC022]NDV23509.1 response regulator [Desulfovibrio sp. JC022]
MRILIVEDELASRKFLTHVMTSYGECDAVEDGAEAVLAFIEALESGNRYDLICLDIMMPEMDGQEALKEIREVEKEHDIPLKLETKVMMTTALADPSNVMEAYYKGGASIYLTKPLDVEKIREAMVELGFLKKSIE